MAPPEESGIRFDKISPVLGVRDVAKAIEFYASRLGFRVVHTADEIRRLACRTPNLKVLTLCGGVPFAPQRTSLEDGAHVVVGTPGRLEEHVRKGSLRLDRAKLLVLDEADRMLEMGFAPDLARIVARAPAARQTLLFSATYSETIDERQVQTKLENEERWARTSAGRGSPAPRATGK